MGDTNRRRRGSPLVYTSECDSLPADRPAGYPHILNIDRFNEGTDSEDLRCADGVATFLWKWDPRHCEAFFDMSRPRYEMARPYRKDGFLVMTIARFGRGVMVSYQYPVRRMMLIRV
jgi:hypothetical protein